MAVTVLDEGTSNSDVGLPGLGNAITAMHDDTNGLIRTINPDQREKSIATFGCNTTQDGQ